MDKNEIARRGSAMKYYKFLTADNKGEYSEYDYTKYLPKDGKPGKWLPKINSIVLCQHGYHACESKDLPGWLNAQLFEVEFSGAVEKGGNKVVGHRIRLVRKVALWNDKTARLFAVWCAREALKLVDNPDPRSVVACDVAELYANGEATADELAAARDAAWAAASAAALDAAWAAARDAAWAAASAAALDAAWAAAWAAVGAAARDSQTKKLIEMMGIANAQR